MHTPGCGQLWMAVALHVCARGLYRCVCVHVSRLVSVHTCIHTCTHGWASLVAQLVKNPPAMRETRSLGWKDPLEKGKATHSSILVWRIPWTVQCMGSQRVRHDPATFTHVGTHARVVTCTSVCAHVCAWECLHVLGCARGAVAVVCPAPPALWGVRPDTVPTGRAGLQGPGGWSGRAIRENQ